MTDIPNRPLGSLFRSAPKELLNILGTSAAILLTVVVGGVLASMLPAEGASPWLFAGCYGAPAAAAFAAYWFVAQKL